MTTQTQTPADTLHVKSSARHSRYSAPVQSLTPSGAGAPVVIIGAGPTGLSAAYHLGRDALLLERQSRVGGWCRSLVDNGFTFDFAGHIMFSKDE
jgi:UDP-galactopyranose mutase